MTDRETIRLYDTRAEDYAQATASDAPDATLSAFIAALPAGGRVLDLGCGPGGAAAHMAAAGLSVEAWDASAGMVTLAARIPGVTARQKTFADLDAVAVFDGVWANFSLLHAPRSDVPGHLSAIARALRPGGMVHVAVKEGTGAKRDTLGRLYTYFGADELVALLREAGLDPGPVVRGSDRGLDGCVASWIAVTARG